MTTACRRDQQQGQRHPEVYGYWRVGDENTGGWSAHANNFFTGTIDDVAVNPAVLGAGRVAAHYLAGQ